MEPTIQKDDIVLVRYFSTDTQRDSVSYGDLVLYKAPAGSSKPLLKRVIAVGGDTIEVRSNQVFVNDRRVEEPYAQYINAEPSSFGPMTIPPDSVFVMGDNRDRSSDSRDYGPVPRENLLGEFVW